jgi:cell division protein FtsI (penicillin-binding protein 3)
MVRKKLDRREAAAAAGCILLAVATLTFYIWHQAAIIQIGYQASRLEEQKVRLNEEIKRLETDKAILLAPDRVTASPVKSSNWSSLNRNRSSTRTSGRTAAMNELGPSWQSRIQKRTVILAFLFLLWFIVLILRLIQLQVIEHRRLLGAVISQSQYERPIVPERGIIYDRHGQVLARSLPAPTVCLIPDEGDLPQDLCARVEKLKTIANLSAKELQKIKSRIEDGETYIYIKRKLSRDQADRISRLNLKSIYVRQESRRFYPLGRLAAHVLGGLSIDGEGQSGVELQFNSRLQGTKGRSLIFRDANRRGYDWEILKEPKPGQDLILTLDETIQYVAERELEKAVREHEASWGTVILSHPASGEILAMATSPTYDPQEYPPSPPELGRNRAIQQNFEPGSMFKIVTASAARETGAVGFNQVFDCSRGYIRVAGWTIRDHKQMGFLSFPEVIIHSSNVGTIMVGQRVGQESLFRMIQSFGFGQQTGLELPGEENGIFHPLGVWSKTSIAAHSIGYEISVTAIQMLQAMNIVANGGVLIPFRLTRTSFNPTGFNPELPPPGTRIISEKTASDLTRRVFEGVVAEGTGKSAGIDGFSVAGKTGTARKLDPDLGVYLASRHLASFVGFVPADRPMISLVVVLDEPRFSLQYGGQVAAPVFREIARRVLLYLHQTPRFDPDKKTVTAHLRSQDRP